LARAGSCSLAATGATSHGQRRPPGLKRASGSEYGVIKLAADTGITPLKRETCPLVPGQLSICFYLTKIFSAPWPTAAAGKQRTKSNRERTMSVCVQALDWSENRPASRRVLIVARLAVRPGPCGIATRRTPHPTLYRHPLRRGERLLLDRLVAQGLHQRRLSAQRAAPKQKRHGMPWRFCFSDCKFSPSRSR